MHLRRSFATTAAALMLAVPMLSSCGFNLSTDRPYTPGAGTDERSGSVDVLSAVIVASQADEGTLIATLSNNSDSKEAVFDSVLGAQGNTVVPGDFAEKTIAPQGFDNFAVSGGVKITGEFEAGDVIPLALGFADGESISIDVPVVTACEEYLGLDPSGSASPSPSGPASSNPSQQPSVGSTESASPAEPDNSDSPSVLPGEDNETVTPTVTPTATGSALPGEEASAESTDRYSCEYTPSQE